MEFLATVTLSENWAIFIVGSLLSVFGWFITKELREIKKRLDDQHLKTHVLNQDINQSFARLVDLEESVELKVGPKFSTMTEAYKNKLGKV